MSIDKENTIFIYNSNEQDSFDVAIKYMEGHDLDPSRLIGINCSNLEILPDYSSFQTEVENDVLSAINSFPETYVVILGYLVPGGFYNGDNIISSTSRIARIHHPLSPSTDNLLLDRKTFRRYNETTSSSKRRVAKTPDPPEASRW